MKRIALAALALVLVFTIVGLFIGTQVQITIGGVQPVQRSPGDVNGDGSLNIADVSAIANFLFGVPPATPLAVCAASPEELDRIVALEEGQAALNEAVNSQAETQGSLLERVTALEAAATPIEGFALIGTNPVTGLNEYRHLQTNIDFVLLPGGTFNMGSPDTEPFRHMDEGPLHQVTLSPFLIAKYPVTQAQYLAVMGENPSFNADCANCPVETVSWDTLNTMDGFLARTGLSLPSEAQWEYAARGGTSTAFFFGDDCLSNMCEFCVTADDFMWYCANAGGTTHPVGEKLPNPFGLYDLYGNVYEWCQDYYNSNFYSSPDATGPDPVFLVDLGSRVMRGNCAGTSDCRSARRGSLGQEGSSRGISFRPVLWPIP